MLRRAFPARAAAPRRRIVVAGGGDPNVVAAFTVTYVDTSHVFTRTPVVSGVTSITGIAPFFVKLDARASTSTAESNTAANVLHHRGYLFSFGEGIGGNWSKSVVGGAKDYDYNNPLTSYTYTVAGTYSLILYVRDSLGRQNTCTLEVVVTAPGAGTTINSGTSWPSPWVDGTIYNINRGSNYTSMGTVDWSGRAGILLRAIGSGADPIISQINFDSRSIDTSSAMTDTRNCRSLGNDIAVVNSSSYHGFKMCGAVGGRVRAHDGMVSALSNWSQGGDPEARANVTYCYGLMLWDTGLMTATGGGNPDYCMIYDIAGVHCRNIECQNDGTNEHAIRGMQYECEYRDCLIWASGSEGNTKTYHIVQGSGVVDVDTPDSMPSDFQVGSHALGRGYAMPSYYTYMINSQFGKSGHGRPQAYGGYSPENNDTPLSSFPKQGTGYCGVENSVFFEPTDEGTSSLGIDLGGLDLYYRNVKLNMGAGSQAAHQEGREPNRIPTNWDGPYLAQSTNTRPVPVP